MVNSWSLLFDNLKMSENFENCYEDSIKSEHWYDNDRNRLIYSKSEDTISFDPNPNRFKYNEDAIPKELQEYISGTYNQHYSAGDDKIQTLDLIEACGDGEAFCRSNILKYASRYDKKGTSRRDILKIMHYAVLLMHFNDKNAKRETYPQ